MNQQNLLQKNKITIPQSIEYLKKNIKLLLSILSDKERYIIEHRFGLTTGKRETLEKTGKHFQITRERVRQIEKCALEKLQRKTETTHLTIIHRLANYLLNQQSGIMLESNLINHILKSLYSENFEKDSNYIMFILTLNESTIKSFNKIVYFPYWKLKTISNSTIDKIAELIVNELEKEEKCINILQLTEKVLKNSAIEDNITQELIRSIINIIRRILIINHTEIGLREWPQINPKILRDKITCIFREKKMPLHYLELTESIREKKFDLKHVHSQAVHNELIRNSDFVLIGKGIYALKEWGYVEGTVKDIIYKVLRDHQPLSQEKILEKVLAQRKVRKVTILLNLRNNPDFQKAGKNEYMLKN